MTPIAAHAAWLRSIDTLVAEHVFGPVDADPDLDPDHRAWVYKQVHDAAGSICDWKCLPQEFTSSWLHAGAVLEKMRERGYHWEITESRSAFYHTVTRQSGRDEATGPLAISLAALRALGVSVPEKP